MGRINREIETAVQKYSDKHGFDPKLIRAIIKQESGRNPEAISEVGAKGLMQTFGQAPITDAIRAGKLQRRPDLKTVDGQIEAGVAYLATLRDHYGINNLNNLLTSYNGGPKQRFAKPDASASELTANAKRRGSSSFDGEQNFNYKTRIINDYIANGGASSSTLAIISQAGEVETVSGVKSGQQIKVETVPALNKPGISKPAQTYNVGVPVDTATVTATGSNTSTTTVGAQNTASLGVGTIDGANAGLSDQFSGQTSEVVPGHQDVSATDAGAGQEVIEAQVNPQVQQVNSNYQDLTDQLSNFQNHQSQTTEALASRNDTLNQNSFDPQEAIQEGQNALETRDIQARGLIDGSLAEQDRLQSERQELSRSIQARTGTDPLQIGSTVDNTSQFQKNTADRLVATEKARIAVGDAKPGTASWFRKKLLGNVFVQGAKDLQAGSQRVRTVEDNLRSSAEANYQSALRNLDDPALVQAKLKADLQLLDLSTQTAVSRASVPIRTFEARAQMVNTLNKGDAGVLSSRRAELELVQSKLEISKSKINFNDGQTNVSQKNVRFKQQQQDRPAEAKRKQIALQSVQLDMKVKKRKLDYDEKYRDTVDAIRTKGYESALLEAESKIITQKQKLALLQDEALQQGITETARNKLKLEAAVLQTKIARQEGITENFKNPAYVQAITDTESNSVFKELESSSAAKRQAEEVADSALPETQVEAQIAQTDKILKDSEAKRALHEVRSKTWEDDLNKEAGSLSPNLEAKYADILDLIRSNGGRADNNPYQAVKLLNQLGDLSDTPTLQKTAQSVLKLAESFALARGASSPDDVDGISMKQAMVTTRDSVRPAFRTYDSDDIGGLLKPEQIAPFASNTDLELILADPASQATLAGSLDVIKTVNNLRTMLESNGVVNARDQALSINDYFNAGIQANNKLRNYKILGIPDQTRFVVRHGMKLPLDVIGIGVGIANSLGFETEKNFDLTNIVDVMSLMTFIVNNGED